MHVRRPSGPPTLRQRARAPPAGRCRPSHLSEPACTCAACRQLPALSPTLCQRAHALPAACSRPSHLPCASAPPTTACPPATTTLLPPHTHRSYPVAHPFAQLSGSDNMVVFQTERCAPA